ncbi:MAG: hypothetical protein AAF725_23660, partial [Acidobacteriota bacterium]
EALLEVYRCAAGLLAAAGLGAALFHRPLLETWGSMQRGIPGTVAALALLALLPFALLLFAARLGRKRAAEGDDAPRAAGRSFEIALVFFWLLAAVLPGLVFFESAWRVEIRSLASGLSAWQERSLQERRARLEGEWRGFLTADQLSRRLEARGDRFFLPVLKARSPAIRGSSLAVLADALPSYNSTSSLIRFRHGQGGEPRLSAPPVARPDAPRAASLLSAHSLFRGLLVPALLLLGGCLLLRRLLALRSLKVVPRGALATLEPAALLDELRRRPGLRRLAILTSNRHWSRLEALEKVDFVDLSSASSAAAQTNAVTGPAPAERPLLVTGIEQSFTDPEAARSAIDRLSEILAAAPERPICLLARADPRALLEESIRERAQAPPGRETAGIVDFGDAQRWLRLLGRFSSAYVPVPAPDARAAGSSQAESPESEYASRLESEYAARLESEYASGLESEYASRLWGCSESERLALLHLAAEGVINPKQSAAVGSLVRRGLLTTRDAGRPLSFVDAGFRRFVIGHARSQALADWEQEAGRRGWQSLRMPVAFVCAAFLLFLVLGNDELLHSLGGEVSGLAALLPVLIGLLAGTRD